MENGTVYWITGLSGAGKTTIGKLFFRKLKSKKESSIFLDGDELRNVFGNDLGYSREERMQCAMRYSKLCRLLSGQGQDVVICTISMFDYIREWNRANIANYKEIYIKVPMEVLEQRNQKGLYSGSGNDVVGVPFTITTTGKAGCRKCLVCMKANRVISFNFIITTS